MHRSNSQGLVDVKILGGSVERQEIRAQTSGRFSVDLQPQGLESLMLFSTSPWASSETQLELDFSMTNQIDQD